jgi:acyl-ACP thioesterase
MPFGAVDAGGRLRFDAAFDFFQEAATNHAEALDVGKAAMLGKGQGWILSRMSVQFDRRPEYQEAVTVRSWPRGSSRLFAMRDFDMRDAADVPVIRARSGWLVIDIEKRRPLRPEAVMDGLPLNEGRDALPDGAAALSARDGLRPCGVRTALYTDIDGNGHANNARYIEWLEDALDAEMLEKADRARLDINYLSEVKRDETIELFQGSIDDAGLADGSLKRAIALEGRRVAAAVFRAELRVQS